MESSKQQRNKKNKKDDPKPNQKNAEPSSNKGGPKTNKKNAHISSNKGTLVTDEDAVRVNNQQKPKESEPRPQRPPRPQRNEPSAPIESSHCAAEKSSRTVTGKETTQEPAKVDHSNLKRETEEITKLNKKFKKREITSNWHRYAAPEPTQGHHKQDESAPADFSDLLQVPVSRGGHLLLKDEQDWSSGSGAALRGYFALDLKKLNHSLACIPLYNQLHVPKHVFTDEEIKEFDDLAWEAKQSFNTDSEITQNDSVRRHQNIDIVTKKIIDTMKEGTLVSKQDPIRIDICSQSKEEYASKKSINNWEKINTFEGHLEKVNGLQDVSIKSATVNINTEKLKMKNNIVSSNKIVPNTDLHSKPEERIGEDEMLKNIMIERTNVESQPVELVLTNNSQVGLPEKLSNLTLDGDNDDLDFLFSFIKPPVSSQMKSGYRPSATIKDAKPSGETLSRDAAHGQSSELDDWLDSVLDD